MIVSTGNISERGMNEGGNYECGVLISHLSNHDRMFFESIRQEALLVNEILYKPACRLVSKTSQEIS